MPKHPDPYEKIAWRGGICDRIDRVAFEVLEDRLRATATIFQLGYNTSVGASSFTHAGGGAYDYWFPGINIARVIRHSRDVGLDAWYRHPPTFTTIHVHGIRHGSKTAHPEAKQQMGNYVAGGDGLWPLIPGDDPRPYRPDPIATFGVDDYHAELNRRAREDRLRHKLRRIGRDIKHLFRAKRKTRRALRRLNH